MNRKDTGELMSVLDKMLGVHIKHAGCKTERMRGGAVGEAWHATVVTKAFGGGAVVTKAFGGGVGVAEAFGGGVGGEGAAAFYIKIVWERIEYRFS